MGLISSIKNAGKKLVSAITGGGSRKKSSSSSSKPSPPNTPATIARDLVSMALGKGYTNKVTVKDGNSEKTYNTVVIGNVSYVVNADGTGQRLLSYSADDNDGIYSYDQIADKKWGYADAGGYAAESLITLNQRHSGGGGGSRYRAPDRPSFITWNEPVPTFSSNLKKVSRYSYFFGIDNLDIKQVNANMNCCFVSKEITLGTMIADTYIKLEAEYNTSENSSMEFYIVDGENEHAILPVYDIIINNEKIFYGIGTRFSIDKSKEIVIKKDGITVDISFEKAMESNDGLYTISYTPLNPYEYKPINSTIKIKVIARLYNRAANAPYATKMKIRKFGGGTLWEDISIQ